jgi:hypothetical protein
MSKSKKARKPKAPRNMVVVGMLLTCKAKKWDARERRSKDARKDREWKDEVG